MREPQGQLVAYPARQLESDASAPGLAEADGRAGTWHIRHFIGCILLPEGDPGFRTCQGLEFEANFLAGVDRRVVSRLTAGQIGRLAGTGKNLESPAPIGVHVCTRRQTIDQAELGLADPAVVLQGDRVSVAV